MTRRGGTTAVLGVLLVIAGLPGCADRPSTIAAAQMPAASPGSMPAEPTHALLYVASPTTVANLRVHVRAPAGRALSIDHCNGDPGWRLHRLEGAQWRDIWSGETDACASSPIRIEAGTARVFELGAYNGHRAPLRPGRYRLVLHPLRWASSDAGAPSGVQVDLPLRQSDAFDVIAPE